MTTPDPTPYIDPTVSSDEDDGTMPRSIATLAAAIVGHRIVKVDRSSFERPWREGSKFYDTHSRGVRLTLDNGTVVRLADTSDCCAYTDLDDVIQHLPDLDHIVTAVTSTNGYARWHILADLGEVLELKVDWSPGNAFYYAFGFVIDVLPAGGDS